MTSSDRLLDAAAHLVVEDGFEALSLSRIALQADVSTDEVLAEFGSLENLLVSMLNREVVALWRSLLDHLERDPRGGLLSRIYRYTLPAVYERPLVRTLYLTDRDGLNTIMRSTHGFAYVPHFGLRPELIVRLQEAGMVRPDVDPKSLAALLATVSAGTSLTAPHAQLDDINKGLFDLLSTAVDADVEDTTPGKLVFLEYALSMAAPEVPR